MSNKWIHHGYIWQRSNNQWNVCYPPYFLFPVGLWAWGRCAQSIVCLLWVYITCTHLVRIERLVVSFYLTSIQVGNIGFSRGTGELFKTELIAYITFTYTFSTTFYSLLTSLKSYELTSLIVDQLFQITCILRRLLDRCSCWEFRRWSITASSIVLLFTL